MANWLSYIAAVLVLAVTQFLHAQERVDIEQFALDFIEAEKAAWERAELEALQALEHGDVVYQNIDGTVFKGCEGHKKRHRRCGSQL